MVRAFAIVPATGASLRMGRPKLLLPWKDSTVIETVLKAWQAGGVGKVVVTVRAGDETLAEICRKAGAEVVIPKSAPLDMKASVRIGLEHVAQKFQPTEYDAWLVAPADLPLLSSDVIRTLIVEHDKTPGDILVPCQAGRRGHPVLFPWLIVEQMRHLKDDEGFNVLLACGLVREISVALPVAGDDLDTPADFVRLQNRHDRRE